MSRNSLPAAVLVALSTILAITPARAKLFPDPGPGPLTATPAAIRVEITLPNGVELLTGSAALSIDSGSDKAEIALFEPSRPVAVPQGTRHVLAPTQLGASALSSLQSRIADRPSPQAAMAISMALCRSVASPADRPFALSVRLAPGAPSLPLIVPGTGLTALTGTPPATLAPCR